jgi:hypothetical protein
MLIAQVAARVHIISTGDVTISTRLNEAIRSSTYFICEKV